MKSQSAPVSHRVLSIIYIIDGQLIRALSAPPLNHSALPLKTIQAYKA